MPWTGIVTAAVTSAWSKGNNWFVLRDRGGEVLRLSRFLHGWQAMVAALEAKVDPKVWRAAVQAQAQPAR